VAKVIIINTCDECPFCKGFYCTKWKLQLEKGDDGLIEVPFGCGWEELGREIEMDFYGENR